MNTFGPIGGIVSPIVFAFLIEEFKDWNLPVYIIGALYLFGASCWWFVNPERRIFAESDAADLAH